MMKKTYKKVLQVLFLVSLCTCFFPLCVHADTPTGTYTTCPINECFPTYRNGSPSTSYNMVNIRNNQSEVRTLCIIEGDYVLSWYTVSLGSYQITYTTGSSCNASYATVNANNTYQGINYAARSMTMRRDANFVSDIAVVNITGMNLYNSSETAFRLAFGDLAEEPIEPTNWGQLRDVSYSTSIAGNNSAAMSNKDIVSWGYPYDTNNNIIEDCEVEIRAVRGNYTGTDKTNLFSKKAIDFVLDNTSMTTLGTYPASQRKAEYTWAEVCEDLSISNFWKITAYLDNETWLKEGWIYQARLINTDENYTGEWQTLYTATSASAEGSEMIVTNNNYDVNVYQALQEITVVNNNTSVVFSYQDTDINITNPDDGTEPSSGTNLWDVLKQLITGIFQILAKLGDLVGDLIGSILDLFRNMFTPQEINQTINNDVNVNINTYLEDDQPGLNDIHTNIDTWKLQLEDIADDYASGGDCILQWDNVSMNLSVFGAGNVTFIPAGTYDLKSAFLNLLSGFGVSYSTYQMLVSAVIYISLIVLISHKVKGFLKT